jgi:hypothetical protein
VTNGIAAAEEARPAPAAITGQITRRLAWAPLRVLAVITGVALIRGLLTLAARTLLGLRSTATARVEGRALVLDVRWSILGRTVRESTTVTPLAGLAAARLENRRRYVHLLVGFGCLAIGTWVGIQWLVDGLRAGFPYLALLGAGVVAAGVLIDLLAYFVVPGGRGRCHMLLALGPWRVRLSGVDPQAARGLLDALRRAGGEPSTPG